MSRIVTRDKDPINLDIDTINKWNWSCLKKNVDVRKIVPSRTCKEIHLFRSVWMNLLGR